MRLEETTIFQDYPYFFDGQFAPENIQQALTEQYQKSLESNGSDFISVTANGFVHAKVLAWDTRHFGMPMARIEHFYFRNGAAIDGVYDELLVWFNAQDIKHISIRVNLNNLNAINFLIAHGFEFLTGKMMLCVETTKHHADPSSGVYSVDYGMDGIDVSKLLEITANNFDENRFIRDPYLEPDKSIKLYEWWVRQEVGKNPENVAVIKKGPAVTGFSLTEKIPVAGVTTAGFVSLIAVSREFKRLGIGSMLLKDCLQRFKTNGIRMVYANVVSTNYSSIALFQSCGFRIYSNLMELRKYIA